MRDVGVVISAGCFLGSCAALPPLEQDGVAISQIVERTKCELALAVPGLEGKYPSGQFQWIKYWTAKIDLTLDTNDQSSFKPTSNYVEPLSQVVLPGVGTFSRMFSIGATGEVSGTGQRTEKLSFTLSLNELMNAKHSPACQLPNEMGLLGNIG